jgi:hypothetical protein
MQTSTGKNGLWRPALVVASANKHRYDFNNTPTGNASPIFMPRQCKSLSFTTIQITIRAARN